MAMGFGPAKSEQFTCPRCRHAAHFEACYNMASDGECSCPPTPTPMIHRGDYEWLIETIHRKQGTGRFAK